MFVGTSSVVIEELSKPHDSRVGNNDRGPLAIGTLFGNFQVSTSGIAFQVKVEQLGFNLYVGHAGLGTSFAKYAPGVRTYFGPCQTMHTRTTHAPICVPTASHVVERNSGARHGYMRSVVPAMSRCRLLDPRSCSTAVPWVASSSNTRNIFLFRRFES